MSIEKYVPRIGENVDASISGHIKWFNENGFKTISSCSGIGFDHSSTHYKKIVPHIIFNIPVSLKYCLLQALDKLNIWIELQYTDQHKSLTLICFFIDSSKIKFRSIIDMEKNQINLQKYRYSDRVVLDKFDNLVMILKNIKT